METVLTILAAAACVLLFSLAVFIHELGHFLAARRLGMRVEAFSVGFGPALWKRRIGGVEYRISAIPFGGYVMLPDMDPEGAKALEGGSGGGDAGGPADGRPREASPLARIIVAFMGPFGNIVLAVFLALVLAAVPGARFGETPAEIGEVIEGGPAERAGILPGDRVVSVNGNPVGSWAEMQTEVQIAGGKPAAFTVERGGTNATIEVSAEREPNSGAYFIMAVSTPGAAKCAAWMPVRNPAGQLAWDVASIWRVLKALVTPREAKAAAGALGGPVMIAEGLYRQVRHNVWDALGFLRFLCVNLAILNLLPIPVLDGSLILFALFELVAKRKLPRRLTDTLSRWFMYILLGLMLFLVWRDVTRSVRIHRAASEAAKAAEQNGE